MTLKKKLELKLVKFKNIKIIYLTPKKQLWGIFNNGVKKCIVRKITNIICLNKFMNNKKLISYNAQIPMRI